VLVGATEQYGTEGNVAQAPWSRVDANTGKATEIKPPVNDITVSSITAVHDGFLLVARACEPPVFEPGDCAGNAAMYFLANGTDQWKQVELPSELAALTPLVLPVEAAAKVGDSSVLVVAPDSKAQAGRTIRMALNWADGTLSLSKTLEPLRPRATCIAGSSLISLANDGTQIVTEGLQSEAKTETTAVPKGIDTSENGAGLNLGCTDGGGLLFSRQPGKEGPVSVNPAGGGEPTAVSSIPIGHYIVSAQSSPSAVVLRTTAVQAPDASDGAVRIDSSLDQQKLSLEVANSYLTTDGATGAIYAIGPTESKVIAGEESKGYKPENIKIQKV
jgi:hypothetical protein